MFLHYFCEHLLQLWLGKLLLLELLELVAGHLGEHHRLLGPEVRRVPVNQGAAAAARRHPQSLTTHAQQISQPATAQAGHALHRHGCSKHHYPWSAGTLVVGE